MIALLLRPKAIAALSCWPCQLEEIVLLVTQAGLADLGGNSGGTFLGELDFPPFVYETDVLFSAELVCGLLGVPLANAT